MLNASLFIKKLYAAGVTLATGVPDSLLANFCQLLDSPRSPISHIPNTSEGAAVALAAGHHLGTGQLGLVYLQNSGLGNAINPLTSLTSSRVCGIPLVLLVGWRSEISETGTQLPDEPQHVHQGAITLKLLELLDIPYWILSNQLDQAEMQINAALEASRALASPVALVARKGLFAASDTTHSATRTGFPSRESIIQQTLASTPAGWPLVATTGKAAREAYEIAKALGQTERTFLCVGAMGHAVQIATGLALNSTQRVICLDGDGSALMHLGSLVVSAKADRLIHIIINNGVHESVGSQPIAHQNLIFSNIAKALGYANTYQVSNIDEFIETLAQVRHSNGSVFVEAMTIPGSRENLSRPQETPQHNKNSFMAFTLGLKEAENVL